MDVTKIKLSETSLELKKGETKELTATVEPEDATNKEVEWESNDTDVATVENGTVTAVGAGEAMITVTSVGNEEVTATCKVTVTEEKETVTFTGRKAKGENIWDEYYVLTPDHEEYINGIDGIYVNGDKWIKYFYKNSLREKGYFLDDANGEIYFYAIKLYQDDAILKDGDIIKITNPDYEDALLKVSIDGDDFSVSEYDGEEETVAVESVVLNKQSITLEKGDSYRLEAEITPDNATDKTLRWYSDDEDVATVDNGVVKALKTGEARITVESANGKSDVCVIEVIKHKTSSGGGSYSLEEGITKNDRDDETPVIGSEEESIFDDVSVNDPRYDAIKNVYEKGWMVGISDRVFAPEGTLTRAMGVTILWNKAGQPEPQGVAPFLDVTSDMWYAKAVAWAYEQGISAGYGDTFGPDDYLTTEQFTIMNDIANGKTPAAYIGGAPNATRGWVAEMISEQ